MEPQLVDIGPVLFDRASEREVSIHNRGRVQFPFDIDASALSRASVCDISPKSGNVMPGQHAVLKLKVGCFTRPALLDGPAQHGMADRFHMYLIVITP